MTKIEFDEASRNELTADVDAFEVINNGKAAAIAGKVSHDTSIGVFGFSPKFQGVAGASNSGIGVVGSSDGQGTGVWGTSSNGIGIQGNSVTNVAISGTSQDNRGVTGFSKKDAGVFGNSVNWYGVYGFAHQDQPGGVLAEGGKHALVARNGTQSVGRFEGNVEVTGDIKLVNADCAEEFDIAEENVDAGTVMVLTNNGTLQASYQEYDKKAAGIVSGAGGYKPALVLDRPDEEKQEQRLPIALMGKVYCKVDARHASIEIGDLLTTSSTKGHAMKAEDPMMAFGAVIGKALGSIKSGLGMIPVLVSLQ